MNSNQVKQLSSTQTSTLSSEVTEQLTVKISGRDYRLSCLPKEKQSLLATVEYVDAKMSAIRANKKVNSQDRVAVLAALQIASELLETRSVETNTSVDPLDFEMLSTKIRAMNRVLDALLNPQDSLFDSSDGFKRF